MWIDLFYAAKDGDLLADCMRVMALDCTPNPTRRRCTTVLNQKFVSYFLYSVMPVCDSVIALARKLQDVWRCWLWFSGLAHNPLSSVFLCSGPDRTCGVLCRFLNGPTDTWVFFVRMNF
jgi:hypothetical protein